MATACLFLGFSSPRPGREGDSNNLLRDTVGQIEAFGKEGWFESYEVIGLTPHCGAINGFLLLKGERAKLDELRRTDAFERVSMLMNRTFEGYGVVPGVTLDGIKKVMERNPDMFR